MEVRWERLTAPELKALAARDALPVLPVGSLEQHGPHLPVWTDSLAAHALSVRAAEQAAAADLPAVVLPPLWLGLSEHHFPFGGTISLDYATFHAVLRCVVRSPPRRRLRAPVHRQRPWRQHRAAGRLRPRARA